MNSSTFSSSRRLAAILLAAVALPAAVFAADAKDNWTQYCGRCHAADGSGSTKIGKKLNAKDYTNAEVQAKLTDEEMLKAIVDGAKDANGKELMQGYKEKISEQEAKDLVAYIRSLKK